MTPQEATQMLVVHGTEYWYANDIMGPNGAMRTGKGIGFLHFVHATNSTTLDQMDQLKWGTAFLTLNMKRISEEFEVWINAVGTITLRKDNHPTHQLTRHYIQYAVGRRGQRLRLKGHENWSTHMGEDPPIFWASFYNPTIHWYMSYRQIALSFSGSAFSENSFSFFLLTVTRPSFPCSR